MPTIAAGIVILTRTFCISLVHAPSKFFSLNAILRRQPLFPEGIHKRRFLLFSVPKFRIGNSQKWVTHLEPWKTKFCPISEFTVYSTVWHCFPAENCKANGCGGLIVGMIYEFPVQVWRVVYLFPVIRVTQPPRSLSNSPQLWEL